MALVARSCRNPCARHFHHMNPMTVADIVNGDEDILDLDNLITTTHNAHNAIQSGDESFWYLPLEPGRPKDAKLW